MGREWVILSLWVGLGMWVRAESAVGVYTSAVSLEVLEDHICSQNCREICAEPVCETNCMENFCVDDIEKSALPQLVGGMCLIGVITVAYSVFCKKNVYEERRRLRQRREVEDYLRF